MKLIKKVNFKQKVTKEEDKIYDKQIKSRAKKKAKNEKYSWKKNSYLVRQIIRTELISENIDFVDSIEKNPLTKDDVIKIIQDNNLSNGAMLKIVLKLLRSEG